VQGDGTPPIDFYFARISNLSLASHVTAVGSASRYMVPRSVSPFQHKLHVVEVRKFRRLIEIDRTPVNQVGYGASTPGGEIDDAIP
jgi:hypothetical protein